MNREMRVGFAVLYQWQIRPGKIRQFCDAWAVITEGLKRDHGALGSRLHRSEQGTWMAYAEWPDRKAWESAGEAPPVNPEALKQLQEAVEDTWPPVLLTSHDDRTGR
jgi:quinol monooxygenase YgiN